MVWTIFENLESERAKKLNIEKITFKVLSNATLRIMVEHLQLQFLISQ